MTTHPTPIPDDEIATIREALEEADERFYNIGLYPEDSSRVMVKAALTAFASIESALATAASAHRAGQEQMRERAKAAVKAVANSPLFDRDEALVVNVLGFACDAITALPLTVEAPGAEAGEAMNRREQIAKLIASSNGPSLAECLSNPDRFVQQYPTSDNAEPPGAKPLDYARRVLDDPVASSGAEVGEPEAKLENWQRCPSTHCERRQECASPSDCIIHTPASASDATLREENARLGREAAAQTRKMAELWFQNQNALSDRDLLRAQVAEARGALKRLATPEAFDVSRVATREETLRMQYAANALAALDASQKEPGNGLV